MPTGERELRQHQAGMGKIRSTHSEVSLGARAGFALPKPHLSELGLQSISDNKPGAGLRLRVQGQSRTEPLEGIGQGDLP